MDNELTVSELGVPPTSVTVAPSIATWPKALLRDLLETVLPALLIAVAIVVFVAQPTSVDGLSMAPTLADGQRLVIEKVTYHFHAPVQGDIIVLKLPDRAGTPLIKRVIATAGDVVAIRNGLVYLNGEPLHESYLNQVTAGNFPSTVVPEGYMFVLGDNRGSSNDSRTFGMVPTDHVVGRAFVSYWPLNTLGLVQ